MSEEVYQLHFRYGHNIVVVQKPISIRPTHDDVIAWGQEALGIEDLAGVTITQVFQNDPQFIGRLTISLSEVTSNGR